MILKRKAEELSAMYFTDQTLTESSSTAQDKPLLDDLIEDQSDKFYLTEKDKLIILIIAVSLFFITLLITVCIVSPSCYFSKLIKKWLPIKTTDQNLNSANPILKQYSISPDSKGFQLTVVPQYVDQFTEKQKLELNLSKNEKINNLKNQKYPPDPINLYNSSLNENNIKRKLLKDIFQNKEINCNTFFLNNKNLDPEDVYDKWNNVNDKLYDNNLILGNLNGLNGLNSFNNFTNNNNDQMEIVCSLNIEKYNNTQTKGNSLRLVLHLKQIKNLPLKSNGLEPTFYVSITGISSNSAFRKATNLKLNAKLSSQLNYTSDTFKPRTLNPMLNLKYYSEELTKSVLKDAKLLIKIVAVEKHANDHCLGELIINLKQVLNDEKAIEKNSFNEKEDVYKCYKLCRPKEIKGELLMSVCYLPTSKRANFSFSKANLNNQLTNLMDFNQNYYVRVIMSCNGKIIKKKKTCSSTKLEWQTNETLTFDLTNLNEYQLEQLCFLIVLVCTQDIITQEASSPSSPDSPVDNNYNNFIKQNSTIEDIKRKVDKNLQKKDNISIGHFFLTTDLWNQVTHEPRKQITKLVQLI